MKDAGDLGSRAPIQTGLMSEKQIFCCDLVMQESLIENIVIKKIITIRTFRVHNLYLRKSYFFFYIYDTDFIILILIYRNNFSLYSKNYFQR